MKQTHWILHNEINLPSLKPPIPENKSIKWNRAFGFTGFAGLCNWDFSRISMSDRYLEKKLSVKQTLQAIYKRN